MHRILIFSLAVMAASAAEFPAPAVDIPAPATKQKATVVLAGGCFWGVEAAFDRPKGERLKCADQIRTIY